MEDVLKKLPPNITKAIAEEDKNYLKQFIMKSLRDLQQITSLSATDATELLYIISKVVLAKEITSVSEIPKIKLLTTGCAAIDSILKGGIPIKGITEIYGQSGVGKTQICLQLCITVQQVFNDNQIQKGAVFICTEDAFPSQRLKQLSKLLPLNLKDFHTSIKLEDNIFVDHIADFEQLKFCLNVKLPALLRNRPIGLIVVDSIAGMFRSENENVSYSKRSKDFLTIASKLNEFCEKYEIAIICINQITDNTATGESDASLGLSWRNLVSHRFQVSRVHGIIRKFQIIFSPYLACNECNFAIKDIGVVDS